MVGTRSHPSGEFPATPTPGSRSPSTSLVPASSKKSRSSSGGWTHTPSTLTLLWLTLSIPIVCWDTAYVLGRPATMPGGWAHAPLFTPYALYGTIDYVYGMPSIVNRDGFGYAQGAMNMVETAGYLWYLYLVFVNGETARRGSGRGAPKDGGAFAKVLGPLVRPRVVDGRAAAVAPVVGLLMSALTLAKTVLYCEFLVLLFSVLRESVAEYLC